MEGCSPLDKTCHYSVIPSLGMPGLGDSAHEYTSWMFALPMGPCKETNVLFPQVHAKRRMMKSPTALFAVPERGGGLGIHGQGAKGTVEPMQQFEAEGDVLYHRRDLKPSAEEKST